MSYMTGPEFLDYMKQDFNRTDKDEELYTSTTDAVWNLRLQFEWEEFKEIVVTEEGQVAEGDHKFGLPQDFGHMIGHVKILDGDSSYPLIPIKKTDYDNLEPHPNYSNVDTSKPTHYAIYGGEVFLYPVPDESFQYEFNYTTESENEVTESTAEVPFTDRYRELLKAKTLYRVYRGLENDNQSAKWQAIAEKLMEDAKKNEKQRTDAPEFVKYHGM